MHMISFIVPSYNNLQHLKNVYASILKHAPTAEVILLDDGSTDGTWEWIQELAEAHQQREVKSYRSASRVGHTILYDKGIAMATNEIVGILHADMVIGPNYVENLTKHVKPGTVVCATRIEPPLHPSGKEKIIKDFGQDFDTLDIKAFEEFCLASQREFANQTTKGMFAPWILYKKDFQAIGGHDPLFAPFPYEDSDIFQRWILAGYELVQSRDAFVYHLTCRGHRWNEQIGRDDEYYKIVSHKAARNYIRKWGAWIQNDDYQYPIITPKYDIGFIIHNCNDQLLNALEPLCSTAYVDCPIDAYIWQEQPNTLYDLLDRVRDINDTKHNNILVTIEGDMFNQNDMNVIINLSKIIQQSNEIGEFELGNLKIQIDRLTTYEHGNIVCEHNIYNK